jgi:catechol 2,3-dioxygenase-like lactoylglutathione lyase family enzyme
MSHATIYVLDQEKAKTFYVDRLGLEVRTDQSMENGFRWLTVGSKEQPDLEISLVSANPGTMFDEETAAQIRSLLEKGVLGSGVFETADCRQAYRELKAKGVDFRSAPKDELYGVEAIMEDGVGNWFSLTEHREPV